MKYVDLKRKLTRVFAFPAVDEALPNWVIQCQDKRVMLIADLIEAIPMQFAMLSGISYNQLLSILNGWLQAF